MSYFVSVFSDMPSLIYLVIFIMLKANAKDVRDESAANDPAYWRRLFEVTQAVLKVSQNLLCQLGTWLELMVKSKGCIGAIRKIHLLDTEEIRDETNIQILD